MKPGRARLARAAILGVALIMLSAGCETYRDNAGELWDQRIDDATRP